jgi:hypothetical protein
MKRQLSDAERLSRAVLLFYKTPPWTEDDRKVWFALTGEDNATTRTLCDLARNIRAKEEAWP